MTIKNILIAILVKEIEPRELSDINPIEIPKTKGTEITLNKLITAVKEIDRATSPFAKEVRILDDKKLEKGTFFTVSSENEVAFESSETTKVFEIISPLNPSYRTYSQLR